MKAKIWADFQISISVPLKVYREKSSSILLRKNCSIHYLHFSFEKHVPSQVWKDFSVENLETTPRSIYLELLIIGIVF